MRSICLLLLLVQVVSTQITSPKNWLILKFTSTYPIDELRLKETPLNFYHRDDLQGTHTIAMDEVPKTWLLEVSNEFDNTSLILFPTRTNKMAKFNIDEQHYEVEYRVACKMGFYGDSCDKMCLPGEGHFTCSSEGEKICHEGWTGANCDKVIDGCTSNPCQHGICLAESSTQFQCICSPGFEGIFCQTRTLFPSKNSWTNSDFIVVAICIGLLLLCFGVFLYFLFSKRTKVESIEMSQSLPFYVNLSQILKKEEMSIKPKILSPELLV